MSDVPKDDPDDVHNPFQGQEDLAEAAAQIAPKDPFAEALAGAAAKGEAQVPEGSEDDPRNVVDVDGDMT